MIEFTSNNSFRSQDGLNIPATGENCEDCGIETEKHEHKQCIECYKKEVSK